MNAAPGIRPTSAPLSDRPSDIRALSAVRSQNAFVRALLDEIERGVPHAAELDQQLVEELARLGCKLLEAAAAVRASLPDSEAAPIESSPPETARCA